MLQIEIRNQDLPLFHLQPAIIETMVDKLAKTADLDASILDRVKLIKKKAIIEDNTPKYARDTRKFLFFKGAKYWANVLALI